jgi:hypothetical protein
VSKRVEFEPDRADDKALLGRIKELVLARSALERELAACVNVYSQRRLKLARAGEPITGALAQPIAPSNTFQADQARREELARQHHENDQAARRDPSTASLFLS